MAHNNELEARAVTAAEYLFNSDEPEETGGLFEPSDENTVNAAIMRFSELFAGLRGIPKFVMEGARNSGDSVSSDPLQGLAEIVQNADDTEATEIVLQLDQDELLVCHNGNPVRLPHVLALATPWLTTKSGQAALMGRFGIGLTTLRSLSDTFEVHCDPYHVRFGDPFVTPIRARRLPAGLDQAGWTTFRVPVSKVAVGEDDLATWLGRWDDSAMLFLRAVSRIVLRSARGESVMELGILRGGQQDVDGGPSFIDGVSRQQVTAQDGRSWMVYQAEFPTPKDMKRGANKATEATTPVAIALPFDEVKGGKIHAGLPVAETRMALFANGQFDPMTSRQGFPDNEWNNALVPIVAELWSVAVLDAFDRDPRSAWQAIPIGDVSEDQHDAPIVRRLEGEVIASARERVAVNLALPVSGRGQLPLRELAVEDKPLERVLTPKETADLAGLEAILPAEIRDARGKWREVLEDWRTAGVDLPAPVRVERALALLEHTAREPGGVVALSAVALRENLGERLLDLPCVVAQDGRCLIPPPKDAPEAVALKVSPLAQQLGVVTALHPVHLADEPDAGKVLNWLSECGALVDGNDDREVVRRLAAAGQSDRQNPRVLQLEQVQALRVVFERLEPDERQRFGAGVGRAVKLDAFEYEMTGKKKRKKKITVEPARAYLPKTIERGEKRGFAVAADKAPGIAWISSHYVRPLRSSLKRQGVGAQRFLGLLGVNKAPKIRKHPRLQKEYEADPRPALAARFYDGISARTEELTNLGATHTLDDSDSPDLKVVVEDIARVRSGPYRRKRAAALISTLTRVWNDQLSEYAQVQSAYGHYRWNETGETSAYWVWQMRDVPWLDDERRKPRRPSELRVRTSAMEAFYGADSTNYLHPDLHDANWQPVLSALGVEEVPSRKQLVDRLKDLRAAMQAGEYPAQEVEKEAAVVYKALAHSLQGPSPRSELNRTQLKQEFASGDGLILTQSGWLSPEHVFGGEAILGNYSAFAPAVSETGALWSALGLSPPSLMDCVKAIRKISRCSQLDDQDAAVLLDALRAINNRDCGSTLTAKERRALRELPLLTTRGWMHQRPVYATDDHSLLEGLGDLVPIWQPGGELHQFDSILGALRVEPIDATAAEVVDADLAEDDEECTDLYRKAVQLLHEDLVRNEPDLARSLTVPCWDRLENFTVRVHSSLSIRVPVGEDGRRKYDCPVAAKVDPDRAVVFVRRRGDLARVDRGGRALSMLFTTGGRQLALAWRGAWDRADEGRPATILELAQERRAREESENELELKDRLSAFREGTSSRAQNRHRVGGGKSEETTSENSSTTGTGDGKEVDPPSRELVNPKTLKVRDPEEQETDETGRSKGRKQPSRTGRGGLVKPRGAVPPKSGTKPPNYTSEQKESIGLELLQMAVGRDLVDIRGQRGVGADALDEKEGRYYELKVSGGNEPDVVSFTTSEVMRAASAGDKFVLAVVSGVEGANAGPTVRLIFDPLKELEAGTEDGKINLAGVRNSQGSCVIRFDNDAVESKDETSASSPK